MTTQPSVELLETHFCFGGEQRRYRHEAESTQCAMTFSIFVPPSALAGQAVPFLYFLSGLTCTDENFSSKAGAQQYAAKHNLALIIPDTSPRGQEVPDDENYDLGQGAGFYVNATQAPWQRHYQMYDYITQELPSVVQTLLSHNGKQAIMGHSMGGHGALTIGLKNPSLYTSASAFAPIVNPSQTAWGQKALSAYLGDNPSAWQDYDALALLEQVPQKIPLLIDQGLADQFYPEQLQPEKFQEKAQSLGFESRLDLHQYYDHSYFFISSFIEKHIAFHAQHLG
ncbi:S-formylglutathione hydrolase [Brackiella oedipodis]|uniref:S-formylglutathione hydrolase n=1 Tax=Brackiella oedipodis TaxID=124225 RepID=UPI00048F8959|nr:S-formylglutathione hydrolase [Brackiella oedipodis]